MRCQLHSSRPDAEHAKVSGSCECVVMTNAVRYQPGLASLWAAHCMHCSTLLMFIALAGVWHCTGSCHTPGVGQHPADAAWPPVHLATGAMRCAAPVGAPPGLLRPQHSVHALHLGPAAATCAGKAELPSTVAMQEKAL